MRLAAFHATSFKNESNIYYIEGLSEYVEYNLAI